MMFRFEGFLLEPAAFQLVKDGVPVRIEPKALEVLIHLVAHRERVVSKQELLDAIWRGTAVTENALSRAIAQVRKVLGDDSESPRFIQTVPTKGYRFVAPVVASDSSAPRETPSRPEPLPERPEILSRAPRRRRRWLRTTLLMFAIVLAGFLIARAITVSVLDARRAKVTLDPKPDLKPQLAGRPLHSGVRLQLYPAFAPDRSVIAYASESDGAPQIFVAKLADGEEKQLTNVPGGATQPAWSPDGRTVAFASPGRGGIWIIPSSGGEPKQMTVTGSRPAWSPDGQEIAFQSGDVIDYGWSSFDALPPSTISIVSVQKRTVLPLTHSGTPSGGHGAPSWHPDGERLAFTSCDIERCAVYTIRRDGREMVPIVNDPRRLSSPLFDSAGANLYYLLVLHNGSILFRRPVDRTGQPIAGAERVRAMTHGVMQHLAIAPNGRQFAWAVVHERSELMSVPAAGGESTQVTRNAIARTMDPTFSPDGTKIAYCASGAGEDSGVWIANADGTRPRGVTVGTRLRQHVQWMPDGFSVAYAAWQDGGATLFEASLVTGKVTPRLVLPRDGSAPALSPDGRRVAFNRPRERGTTVWVASTDMTDLRQVTDERDFARSATWSPNGRFISVQVRGKNAIGIIDDTSMKVLPWAGEVWPNEWSPDETEIAFAGRQNGVWNVWAMSVRTGQARRITNHRTMSVTVRTPAWSPDGSTIVYESGKPEANIWVSESL